MAAAALIAAALLPLQLGAGLAYDWDATLRLEERARQVKPIPGAATTTWASEAQPTLSLLATGRTAGLTASYDPRVTYAPSNTGRDTTWLHLASLVGTWRPEEAWRLRLVGQLTRGSNDLFRFLSNTAPGESAPPTAQLAPVVTTIDYQNYDLGASADVSASTRLAFRAALGASREGGLNARARDFLPLSQGGRASTGLDWRLTRVDTLAATLSGSVVHYFDVPLTSTGAAGGPTRASWSVWSSRLMGTWRRGVDRQSSASVSAGLAVVGGDRAGQDALRVLPSAEVAVTHEPKVRDQRVQGGLALAVAPLEDRLAGAIEERADLRGWITWIPVDRWSLRGAASGGVVVTGGSKDDAIGSADARVGWAATSFMDLSLGLRASLQHQARLTVPRFLEWNAYLAVSLASKGRL